MEGDFIAQVRVAGTFEPVPGPDEGSAHRGAGLVAMGEGKVVFLGGGALLRPERAVSTVKLEVKGERGGGVAKYVEDVSPPRPLYLRLERQGTWVLAAFGEDGVHWTPFDRMFVKLPQKLKVGVAAETTSGKVFKPEFDQFRLSRPKK